MSRAIPSRNTTPRLRLLAQTNAKPQLFKKKILVPPYHQSPTRTTVHRPIFLSIGKFPIFLHSEPVSGG